jgi:hypothetical protein
MIEVKGQRKKQGIEVEGQRFVKRERTIISYLLPSKVGLQSKQRTNKSH